MQYVARLTLTTLATCLLLGGVFVARPAFLADLNMDVGALPQLWEWLDRERQREEELEGLQAAIEERSRAKDEVLDKLIEGRLTLFQAADRFRRFSRDFPPFWTALECKHPSLPEEERLYRYIIEYAEVALESEPRKARTVTRRLRAELEETLRGHSPFTLPH